MSHSFLEPPLAVQSPFFFVQHCWMLALFWFLVALQLVGVAPHLELNSAGEAQRGFLSPEVALYVISARAYRITIVIAVNARARRDHIVLTKSSRTTISKTGKLFLSFSWNSTALEEEEIHSYETDVLKQNSQGMLIRSRCLSCDLKFSQEVEIFHFPLCQSLVRFCCCLLSELHSVIVTMRFRLQHSRRPPQSRVVNNAQYHKK